MLARYREVVDAVLSYRASKADNRDHLLRRAAIDLIPRLAAFAPERFASSYLTTCAEFLLGSLKCVLSTCLGGTPHALRGHGHMI